MLRRGKPQPQHKEMRKLEQEMETAIRIFPFQLFDNVKELEIEQPITAEAVGDSFFVVPTISGEWNMDVIWLRNGIRWNIDYINYVNREN